MTIDDIKRHGAILGLEAEMNNRLSLTRAAYEKKEWTTVYSHEVYIQELAEELRKLKEKDEKKVTIKDDEFLSLLQNLSTITDAMILVAKVAGTGNIGATLAAYARAQKLIMQAIKSSQATLHNIRTQNDEIRSNDPL